MVPVFFIQNNILNKKINFFLCIIYFISLEFKYLF